MKPSEMKSGKKYRVTLEGYVQELKYSPHYMLMNEHSVLSDEMDHVISVEEISAYPNQTVAIHYGNKGAVFVYMKAGAGWYKGSEFFGNEVDEEVAVTPMNHNYRVVVVYPDGYESEERSFTPDGELQVKLVV